MAAGLITFFRETTDARGLSWLRICERVGGSRQRIFYALRNCGRGSAVLCVRFADLLGLDRRAARPNNPNFPPAPGRGGHEH